MPFVISLLISRCLSVPPGLFYSLNNIRLLSHMSGSSVGFRVSSSVFAEDHTGCISHCIVEVVGQCT